MNYNQYTRDDWDRYQDLYDTGMSTLDIMSDARNRGERCPCSATFARAVKLGVFKPRSNRDSHQTSLLRHPRKPHSDATKAKISKARIKFLTENPHMIPYKLNHKSKGPSYPERYFTEVFELENIQLEAEYRIGLYSLDFACPNRKIDIEIDGSQHRVDKRIREHDKKRDAYMAERGWIVFRIYWPEYQKKTFDEKSMVVSHIKKLIGW